MAKPQGPAIENPDAPPRAPWIVRFIGGLAGLAVMTLLVFALLVFASHFAITQFIRGESVPVPNLVNRPLNTALEEVGDLGLNLQFDTGEYSDTVAEGAILRQQPRPQRLAKVGTAVRVVVSRGPLYATVPDVVGLNEIDAGIVLRSNDLEIGVTSRVHHPSVPADEVIAQSPRHSEGGLRRGQGVNLLVSLGPPPGVFTSPNLRGLTVPEAQEALASLGASVGQQTERDAPPGVAGGVILEQSPAPGAPLPEGSTLSVVIARRADAPALMLQGSPALP
jgi:serine/threonine-protein kinase